MNNKLLLTISILLPVSLLVSFSISNAISLSPSTGSCVAGQTIAINVTATNPPSNTDLVQLGFSLTGPGEITGYLPPSAVSWGAPTPQCSNGNMYDTNSVCVDLTKDTGSVSNGESLGTFTLKCTGTGTIVISDDSDNGYDNGSFQAYTTTSGSFSSTGVLPSTSVLDDVKFLLIGIAFIVLALSLKRQPFYTEN